MAAKILVSGVSGPIGAMLLPALAARGDEVTRLVRGQAVGPNQVCWHPTQPLSPQAVSGFDAVIHLAGESIVGRWTAARKKSIRDSRVLGTQHLAQALSKAGHPPRVFVCASAVGYYGNRCDELLREESPSGTGFLADVCREWEAAAQAAAAAGIRIVQVRIGLVLSGSGGALQSMLPAFRVGLGGRIGSGQQWWSWIDVQDLVSATLHIMKTESLHGPVNLVAPNPVRNAEFTKTLASVLSRPAVFPMPAFMARLAFGQMGDELLLASQRVEAAKLVASGYDFQRPTLEPSLRAILKR